MPGFRHVITIAENASKIPSKASLTFPASEC